MKVEKSRENNKEYKKRVFENNFEMDIPSGKIDEFDYSVDECFDRENINFLSEWSFDKKIHEYTSFNKNYFEIEPQIPLQYVFPDTNRELNKSIEEFHVKEGLPKDSFTVFISEGSTPMIAAMVLFAKKAGFSSIHSIFPLYFTIHKMCDVLDVNIFPCNNDFTCFDNIDLNLPKRKSFLFITDPIWSIGRHHSKEIFERLAKWQKKTESIIFVDNSFSYMDWDVSVKREPSVVLNPDLTLRLVCPTKSLCLHGLRFSYLLCPKKFSKELARISIANTGSSSYFNHLQRGKVFKKMIEDKPNPVGLFASDRYNLLKKVFSKNKIKCIIPDCGFLCSQTWMKLLKKEK